MLTRGALLLDDVLTAHGFSFVLRGEGPGPGGRFAAGDFVRDERRLELHARQTLGLVTYHVGAAHVSGVGCMEELGVRRQAAYPGFSDDPLDGFRHLDDDLERFAKDFLAGEGAVMVRAAARERLASESTARALVAGHVGDDRNRAEAKRRFDATDWAATDRRRLEIARRRMRQR